MSCTTSTTAQKRMMMDEDDHDDVEAVQPSKARRTGPSPLDQESKKEDDTFLGPEIRLSKLRTAVEDCNGHSIIETMLAPRGLEFLASQTPKEAEATFLADLKLYYEYEYDDDNTWGRVEPVVQALLSQDENSESRPPVYKLLEQRTEAIADIRKDMPVYEDGEDAEWHLPTATQSTINKAVQSALVAMSEHSMLDNADQYYNIGYSLYYMLRDMYISQAE